MDPEKPMNPSRAFLVGLAVAFPAVARAAEPLPAFGADLAQTSVSGLSSGAFMAGQFHVAFSETIVGAGIVAGGPYDCAGGSVAFAMNRCMDTALGLPDPARLVRRAQDRAADGEIDPLAGLAADRVYVFSGTEDGTVTPPVVAATAEFYRLAGVPEGQLAVVDDMPAGHAVLTEASGNACGFTGDPFVNDCDYDQAGAILEHIYGDLAPPAAEPQGRLIEFDQREFLNDPTAHGMALTGFAYLPADCADAAAGCRVHVAFHGCRQTEALVGDAFLRTAGYNRWADTNRLIVLYPQATRTSLNPNSCWDWWGYDDARYPTRTGRQMAAVRAMLDRLAGVSEPPEPFCRRDDAPNLAHWQAGRARVCNVWFICAVGSGEPLGLPASTTTLFEQPKGNFGTAACAS
jgi:poly(3-hydroxybutyrate) depolymerase